jgi:hypothetical protein
MLQGNKKLPLQEYDPCDIPLTYIKLAGDPPALVLDGIAHGNPMGLSIKKLGYGNSPDDSKGLSGAEVLKCNFCRYLCRHTHNYYLKTI